MKIMFENCISSSTSQLKRHCTDTDTEYTPKKLKLEVCSTENNEHAFKGHCYLVSLLLNGQNKNVQIYPGQIVWCRCNKSPFWPAMVWSSKSGKITDDKQRVLVKFFAKKDANVWVKLDTIFPFDGLESFEQRKNSVDVSLMTRTTKRDYDFAFNVTSELWCRAVAEAKHCMCKDREERLALFLAFSSSYKLQKRRKKPLSRRSLELNTSNRCLLQAFKVNDEMGRVQSFIKSISFSADESDSEEIIQSADEMLLKFITESRFSNRVDYSADKICNICLSRCTSTEQLIKCAGTACDGYLHRKCFDHRAPQRLDNRDTDGESTGNNFVCEYCSDEWKTFCFVCKTVENPTEPEMLNCTIPNCWRRYHVNCLENWPQAKWNGSYGDSNFICPSHECHQCATNAIEELNTEVKLTNCIKCPTALHNDANCIHAGTVVLSDSQHICIKHRQLRQTISNLDYCYICKVGCNLLRCRTCPHSYHESCLSTLTFTSISACAKCFIGQRPVYGDIVWAKLYTYAWWPAIIVPPHCIPPNIRTDNHSPHDICACFFGDYSFAWIDTQSVHPFDEENYALYTENSNKFNEAILSARKWFSQAKCIKMQTQTEATPSSTLQTSTESDPSSTSTDCLITPPLPYTTIGDNVLVAPATRFLDANNEASPCQCHTYNDDDPCGVSSNCLNRASCTECNELCPNGDKCGNKCIQRGQYAAVHLKYFGKKGFGLVATESIQRGTIVQQYTGEVITGAEYERRIKDKMRRNVFIMKYTRDKFLDAETKGSLARFINHSCDPNCVFRIWSVSGVNVVVVVALKNIRKDTEITCKYDWSRNIPCLCNEDNCYGFC